MPATLLYRLFLTARIDWKATHIPKSGSTLKFAVFYFTSLLTDSHPSYGTLTLLAKKGETIESFLKFPISNKDKPQ